MGDHHATTDAGKLSPAEEHAFNMVQAAIILDQSKGDLGKLAAALAHNLELWVGVRTLISRPDSHVSPELRENLTRLADYVAGTTMTHGVEISPETLEILININLQVSEGMLEGAAR